MGLRAVLAVLALLVCLVAPGSGAAQATVRAARVTVDVTPEGATVHAEYEVAVDGAPDGALDSVEVSLLEHPGATGAEVRDDLGLPVYLANASRTRRTARVALPSPSEGVARIGFRYDVSGALALGARTVLARVPVVSVSLPPASDRGDVFTATVRVPEDWVITEGFPSALASVEPGVYRATLPVVPSMVSVRGRTDGRWRPGVDLLVELLMAAILLAFAVAAWRRMGRPA